MSRGLGDVYKRQVQGAIKGLLDKDFVTCELGEYKVYDKFFEIWLLKQSK